jgi:hypothetical protein
MLITHYKFGASNCTGRSKSCAHHTKQLYFAGLMHKLQDIQHLLLMFVTLHLRNIASLASVSWISPIWNWSTFPKSVDYSRYRRIVRNCRIRIIPTKLVCNMCVRTGEIMFHNENSFLGKRHDCHAINKAILQTSYDWHTTDGVSTH